MKSLAISLSLLAAVSNAAVQTTVWEDFTVTVTRHTFFKSNAVTTSAELSSTQISSSLPSSSSRPEITGPVITSSVTGVSTTSSGKSSIQAPTGSLSFRYSNSSSVDTGSGYSSSSYVEIVSTDSVQATSSADATDASSTVSSTDSSQVSSTDSSQVSSTDSTQASSTDSSQASSTDSSQVSSTDSTQASSTDSTQVSSTDSTQVSSTDPSQASSTDSSQASSTDSSQVSSTDSVSSSQITSASATSSTSSSTPQPKTLDSATANLILAEHNAKRALHIDTPPLTWSDDLSAWAYNYANSLSGTFYDPCSGNLLHSTTRNNQGENIAFGTYSSATALVDYWYNEIRYYDYNNVTGIVHDGYDVGHFTQLVWASTTEVGCAAIECPANNGLYLLCEYTPAGNVYIGNSDDIFALFTTNVLPLIPQ
ncbi:hypothetical protein HG537_0B00670 [Torulaspora globosa]|uniref:SCP domain-containing protein n=1 Tax=Torulaspora globosa TaxID=48254 RepID=A0A7H9HLP1_9SACH|nr:hypothetical protein HG537_0B00670 [Torulaspora sp. CBS 2947]